MHKSPDRREPCGGKNQAPYFGGCLNNASEATAPKFTNVTYFLDDTGSWHNSPYIRYNEVGLPSCISLPTCPPCGEWNTGSLYGSSSVVIGPTGYQNYFQYASASVDFSKCFKSGFKTTQAKRVWHGRYGLTSKQPSGCIVDCTCLEPSLSTLVDTTKYLTKRINFSQSFTGRVYYDPVFLEYTHRWDETTTRTYTVDANSGKKTLTNCSSSSYIHSWEDGTVLTTGSLGGVLPYYYMAKIDTAETFAYGNAPCSILSFPVIGGGDASLDDWTGKTPAQLEAHLSNNLDLQNPPTTTGYYSQSAVVTCENTLLKVVITSQDRSTYWDGSSTRYQEGDSTVTYEIELTDEWTAKNLLDDTYELLGKWNLSDDSQYPWRTDQYPTVAPQVTRNEYTQTQTPDLWTDCSYTDSASYTGVIRGEPMPAGYQKFFDAQHKTWKKCQNIFTGVWHWYIDSYGALSGDNIAGDITDFYVPMTATQWTDNYEASNVWTPSAMVLFTGDVLYIQKWAETLIPRKSLKLSRPCGMDRFTPNHKTSSCFSDDGVSVIYPTYYANWDDSGSLLICGNGTLDGVWEFTKVNDYQLQLDTLVASSSWIPTVDNNPNCGTSGRASQLSWFKQPAICGRNYITSTSSFNPVTASLETNPHWLVDNDLVYVVDANGNHQLKTVKRFSNTQVVLKDTVTGSSMVYLRSPFSADWKWDDDESKRTFSILEYNYDYREVGEISRLQSQYLGCGCGDNPASVRQQQVTLGVPQEVKDLTCHGSCLKWNACYPSVVYISDRDEGFPSGSFYRLSIPEFNLDSRYSNRWLAKVQQWVVDPFYQQPTGKPCVSYYEWSDPWVQDNGNCIGDYPTTQYIEAMCGRPEGSPIIPVPFGVAESQDLNGSNVENRIVYPPVETNGSVNETDGRPTPTAMPIYIYLNQVECACSNGTFSSVYESRDGVTCEEFGI